MRYFLYFSYDGTDYHGWQRQPNAMSVQEKMEDVLQLYFGHKVNLVAAGRTDTGVHARLMVAHFDIDQDFAAQQLIFKLNCLLPSDISVSDIRPVTSEGHARFSAKARTYHYYLSLRKDPFRLRFSCRYYHSLDFDLMNEGARLLMRHTDFGSFCKAGSDNKTNICHITQAVWTEVAPGLWRFSITADRFLRNMVRAIVGTLVDVGRGRMTVQQFCDIIERKDRCAAGQSMPGNALFLADITYPEHIFIF